MKADRTVIRDCGRALLWYFGGLAVGMVLVASAWATPSGYCTGVGTVAGPDTSIGGQVWVTDAAESYNQQTAAADAFASSRGCTRTNIWGRQTSSVGFELGSCANPAHDGGYSWTDDANPCDMSQLDGDPGAESPYIDGETVALIFASISGCWALGFGMGKSVAWVRKIASVA